MDTKDLTVAIGTHDSSTYTGTEVKGINLTLKGSLLVMTGNKVSYFRGDLYKSNEQIGTFEYRTADYRMNGHPGNDAVCAPYITKDDYFRYSPEASELLLASIAKIQNDFQTTQNTK